MPMNLPSVVQIYRTAKSEPKRKQFTTDSWTTRDTFLDTIGPDLLALNKQSEVIMRSPTLSDRGKAEELAKLAGGFVRNFGWLKRELADRAQTIRRNETTLFSVASPVEDKLLRGLQAAEIRGQYYDLDDGERVRRFVKAAEVNHLEELSAVLSAPGVEPLIALDITSSAMQARAENLFGGEGGLLAIYEQQKLLHEEMCAWRDWIGDCLGNLGADRQKIAATLGTTEAEQTTQPVGAAAACND